MCAAIKNTTSGSEWHCLSYLIPSPPCPHFILIHRKNTTTSQPGQVFNVSIDRALQDQPEGTCQNLSTFFLPFGVSPNVPLLFCSSSKNSRWLLHTGAACENVLFALSPPASVIRPLQTFRFPQTLLCQLFFMMVWDLEDNSRAAVYRDSLSFRAGFLPPLIPVTGSLLQSSPERSIG